MRKTVFTAGLFCVPLSSADAGEGVYAYTSAHPEGADSEKVISTGHSAQETPETIIEIRRIMHLHLKETGKK